MVEEKDGMEQSPVVPEKLSSSSSNLEQQAAKAKLVEAAKQLCGARSAELIAQIVEEDKEKPLPPQIHKAGRQLAKAQKTAVKAQQSLQALDASWEDFASAMAARYQEKLHAYKENKSQWQQVLANAVEEEKTAKQLLQQLAAENVSEPGLPKEEGGQAKAGKDNMPDLALPPGPEEIEDVDESMVNCAEPSAADGPAKKVDKDKDKDKKMRPSAAKEQPKKKAKVDKNQAPLQFQRAGARDRSRSSGNRFGPLGEDEEEG